jgi:Zn-dependent peptidase ImmA (M78 family)
MELSHIKQYSYPEIEHIVIRLLNTVFPDLLNIPVDIDLIAEKRGIEVWIQEDLLLQTGISEAVLVYSKDTKTSILVDADANVKNKARANFSVAHELGHAVLHPYLYCDCKNINDSIELKRKIKQSYKYIEGQVNYFAGAVLIPRKTLFPDMQEIYKGIMRGLSPDIVDNVNKIKPRLISTLAYRYAVSFEVMKIRLEQLKVEENIDEAVKNRWSEIVFY